MGCIATLLALAAFASCVAQAATASQFLHHLSPAHVDVVAATKLCADGLPRNTDLAENSLLHILAILRKEAADAASVSQLLGCVLDTGVMDRHVLGSESGAELVYAAVLHKDIPLLQRLLRQGAAATFVEEPARWNAMFAALAQVRKVRQLAQVCLRAHDPSVAGEALANTVEYVFRSVDTVASSGVLSSAGLHRIQRAAARLTGLQRYPAAVDVRSAAAAFRAKYRGRALTALVHTVYAEDLRVLLCGVSSALLMTLLQPCGQDAAYADTMRQLVWAQDRHGRTPLFVAASTGNTDAARALVRLAASAPGRTLRFPLPLEALPAPAAPAAKQAAQQYVLLTDTLGMDALLLACAGGHSETAAFLAATAAGIDDRDMDGAYGLRACDTVLKLEVATRWGGQQALPSTVETNNRTGSVSAAAAGGQQGLNGGWIDDTAGLSLVNRLLSALPATTTTTTSSSACQVPVAPPNITAEEFLRRYYLLSLPVLLPGAAAGWAFRDHLSADSLAAATRPGGPLHGKLVSISDIPYATTHGGVWHKTSWAGYVDRLRGVEAADGAFEATSASTVSSSSTLSTSPSSSVGGAGSVSAPLYFFSSPTASAAAGAGAGSGGGAREFLQIANVTATPPFLRGHVPALAASLHDAQEVSVMPAGGVASAEEHQHQQQPLVLDPLLEVGVPRHEQAYLGGAGTGAPEHFHRHAFNALAWGQKEWFVRHPRLAAFSTIPVARYVAELGQASSSHHNSNEAQDYEEDEQEEAEEEEEEATDYNSFIALDGAGSTVVWSTRRGRGQQPQQQPQRCVQAAGDVMWIPRGWGHAVLNSRTSAGVAIESSTALERY